MFDINFNIIHIPEEIIKGSILDIKMYYSNTDHQKKTFHKEILV